MVVFFHGHVSFQESSGFVGGLFYRSSMIKSNDAFQSRKPSQIHWRDSLRCRFFCYFTKSQICGKLFVVVLG